MRVGTPDGLARTSADRVDLFNNGDQHHARCRDRHNANRGHLVQLALEIINRAIETPTVSSLQDVLLRDQGHEIEGSAL